MLDVGFRGSGSGHGEAVDVETGFWEARRRRRRRQKPAAGAKILAFFSVITPFSVLAVSGLDGHVRTCPDMSRHVQAHGCNPVRAPPR